MHDTRGRVRIEKTPEGDGNYLLFRILSSSFVRIEKTPEGDGNSQSCRKIPSDGL